MHEYRAQLWERLHEAWELAEEALSLVEAIELRTDLEVWMDRLNGGEFVRRPTDE